MTPQLEWKELEPLRELGAVGHGWECEALDGALKFLITRTVRPGGRRDQWRCHVVHMPAQNCMRGIYGGAKNLDEAKEACAEYVRRFLQ